MTIRRSPLAEGRWLWRRLYVFGVTAGLWGQTAWAVRRMDASALPRVVDALMLLMGLVLVIYLVAPTTQQVIELAAQLRLRLARWRS